jgi:hypothetical protein
MITTFVDSAVLAAKQRVAVDRTQLFTADSRHEAAVTLATPGRVLILLSGREDRNSDESAIYPTATKRRSRVAQRVGTLLVPVQGLSGTTYDAGTKVVVSGRGSSVDAFVNGDWLPLAWWEFADGNLEDNIAAGRPSDSD